MRKQGARWSENPTERRIVDRIEQAETQGAHLSPPAGLPPFYRNGKLVA